MCPASVRLGRQSKAGGSAWKLERESLELLEVQRGESLEPVGGVGGETDAHDAVVVLVASARDEARGIGAVDETDGGVMAQEQVVGDLADRRSPWIRVAADGEQELMLGRRQPGGCRLLLAPAQEATQPGAQGEQLRVCLIAQHRS